MAVINTACLHLACGAASTARHTQPPCCTRQADPYDFSDPKPILGDLKKEFWEGLESKKWSERRDALAQLRGLATTPRIASGDYGDVNRELRKVAVPPPLAGLS